MEHRYKQMCYFAKDSISYFLPENYVVVFIIKFMLSHKKQFSTQTGFLLPLFSKQLENLKLEKSLNDISVILRFK